MKAIFLILLFLPPHLIAQTSFDFKELFEESDLILSAYLTEINQAVGWAFIMEAEVIEIYKGEYDEDDLLLFIYPFSEFDLEDGSTRVMFFKYIPEKQYGPPEGFIGDSGYWELLAVDKFRDFMEEDSADLQREHP